MKKPSHRDIGVAIIIFLLSGAFWWGIASLYYNI